MASAVNVDRIFFERAKWKLKLLVPAWAFQIMILLGLMGIFAYRVAETVEHYSESKQNGQIPMVEIVWESTNVAFSTLALVCTIIEISKMATETLTPFSMVCTHIIKLTLALAMLGLDVTVHIQGLDHEYSIVGLSLDCGFLALAILTLVHTIIIYRRVVAYEAYQLTANASKPFAAADAIYARRENPSTTNATTVAYHDLELGNHVSISSPNDRRKSAASTTASARESVVDLEGEVARRIGVEFGWASSPSASGISVERSSSVVASGYVPSAKVSPTPSELRRTKSFIPEIEGGEEEEDGERYHDARRRSGGGAYEEGMPTVMATGHHEEEEGEEDTRRLLPGGEK